MKLLYYLLELSVTLCFFFFVLRAHAKINPFRLLSIVSLNILWIPLQVLTDLPVPNTFIILAIIFLLFQEPMYFKLCWGIICPLVTGITSSIIYYIAYYLTGGASKALSDYWASDTLAFILLICASLYFYFKMGHKLPDFHLIDAKNYIIIIAVALIDFFLSSISATLFVTKLNTQGRHFIVFAITIMVFMSIYLLVIYFRLLQYHIILQQKNTLNQRCLQLEQQHYHDLQKKNDDLRAFRHDYNHHITALQAIARQEDWPKLKSYIQNLVALKEQTCHFATNNIVADAVVNYFYESISKDIDFRINGKFQTNLFVQENDLCTLLSNLLKNAVEAVEKLTSSDSRRIYIEISSDEQELMLVTENHSLPYSPKELDHLRTSKADKKNHGFGLMNMQKVVEQYHGQLTFDWHDGIFFTYIYLQQVTEG